MMIDLDTVTCSHVRLHEAMLRAARAQLWLIAPLAIGVFAVMVWWAQPAAPAALYAPYAALACLVTLAAGIGYALVKGHEAGCAARELSAVHDLVLAASEQQEEEEPDGQPESPRAG